jgi:hypothetical protein
MRELMTDDVGSSPRVEDSRLRSSRSTDSSKSGSSGLGPSRSVSASSVAIRRFSSCRPPKRKKTTTLSRALIT